MLKTITSLRMSYLVVPDRAHFLSSLSLIESQIVEFEHVTSLPFARVSQVLAPVIRVFKVCLSSNLAEFEF